MCYIPSAFLFYPNVGIYDWDKEVLYTGCIKVSIQDYHQFPLFLWNSSQLEGYLAVRYLGIMALSKQLKWEVGQTSIFSALFLFSPIIIQHVSIGYLPWMNLYLFPWLLYFLADEDAIKRCIGSGLVLALVLLQGGLLVFVWLVFFTVFYLLLLAIVRKKGHILWSIPLTLGSSALMAFPRLYLSMQSLADFAQRFVSVY